MRGSRDLFVSVPSSRVERRKERESLVLDQIYFQSPISFEVDDQKIEIFQIIHLKLLKCSLVAPVEQKMSQQEVERGSGDRATFEFLFSINRSEASFFSLEWQLLDIPTSSV